MSEAPQSPAPAPASDPAELQREVARLRGEQNFANGFGAGAVAALIGAVVWAAVTVFTGYQIGWMALGVGILVGLAVRRFGRGVEPRFGILGAGLALFGCLLGNLFAVIGLVAVQEQTSVLAIWGVLEWGAVPGVMAATFSPMDLVFYGIAVYEGYQFSFREIAPATPPGAAPAAP